MQKVIKLQRAMLFNNRFSYADLERHTSLSRPFIRKKLVGYEEAGFVRRAGMGGSNEKVWRLTQEGKRQFDPNMPKTPAVNTLEGGREGGYQNHDPELRLWTAIRELKRFKINELLELKLANDTTARQYVALLSRAGMLIKKRVKGTKGGSPAIYTVAETAGPLAPLMGRTFYIFDRNTGDYFATPMEQFETME